MLPGGSDARSVSVAARDRAAGVRPVAGAYPELLYVPVRVVTTVGCHRVLVSARPKLDAGRGIWAAGGARPDERWRSGERARIDAAVEADLQVGALLRIERHFVGVTRLRDEHQRHRARADRE